MSSPPRSQVSCMTRVAGEAPASPHDGAGGPSRRLARVVATVLLLAVPSALLAVWADAAGADEPGSASEALAWVDSELDSNGGFLPAPSSDQPDWGLTADAALAHIAAADPTSQRTREIAGSLLEALDSYSTWDELGAEYSGVRLAGPLAKVLLVAASAGLDTSDVDGLDLAVELGALMQTSGEQVGRFSDRNPHGRDNSNGFGQAYAMLASKVTGDIPPQSVGFLLSQQCPSGGFRLVYEGSGCGSDDESDPDATALAIQVLLVLDRNEAVEAALAAAVGQVLSLQAPDGSFAGAPPTDVPNANSTGLAAQALRAAGQTEAADRAADWVAGQLQLGASAVGTPAEADVGAIAYDPARRAQALTDGLGTGRDQWRRSTPQGLLALGAGPFVEGVDEPPVEPVIPTTTTPTTTTSTTTSTAAPAGGTPPGVAAGGSGSAEPSGTVPADSGAPIAGSDSQVAGAQEEGAQLAVTGSDGGDLTAVGITLLLLGSAAIWLGIRTRPRREAWTWRP